MSKLAPTVALLLSTLPAALICGISSSASAAPAVSLGTASSFAVLAGTTVTNSGNSVINGNLGVWPGAAITGFGPAPGVLGRGIVNGTQYAGGSATGPSGTAQGDLTTAYNNLAGLPCGTTLTGSDLGSLAPLSPGVYCFSSSAQLTGTLALNEQGADNQEFVFQIGTALNTAPNSAVTEINPGPTNGGADNNIFWQIGSSATLGTGTEFLGTIVALTSIALDVGATIPDGALLARNGAVTLLDNSISVDTGTGSTCQTGAAECTPNPNPNSVPEPSTLIGLGTALVVLLGLGRRRDRMKLQWPHQYANESNSPTALGSSATA